MSTIAASCMPARDVRMIADEVAQATRRVRCPTCGAATGWRGNPQRPFCSLTCRLIDLGGWLDERYRIASRDEDDATNGANVP
jgi:endogenous inhibitor of DNA gyrase (YacG/DUF329 family)